MRICPHCNTEIPDENRDIYCPHCNHIIDENVLLRMKIEKKIDKGGSSASQTPKRYEQEPLKGKPRKDDDFGYVFQENKKSPVPFIIAGIVIVALVAAYFLFLA